MAYIVLVYIVMAYSNVYIFQDSFEELSLKLYDTVQREVDPMKQVCFSQSSYL